MCYGAASAAPIAQNSRRLVQATGSLTRRARHRCPADGRAALYRKSRASMSSSVSWRCWRNRAPVCSRRSSTRGSRTMSVRLERSHQCHERGRRSSPVARACCAGNDEAAEIALVAHVKITHDVACDIGIEVVLVEESCRDIRGVKGGVRPPYHKLR